MDALLLAAGLGTRLHPLTSVLPKCLMPIQGRPLLGLWLEMLKRGGVERIFVNLHYLSPLVRDYVNTSPYSEHVTFLEEPELLGTAGTLGQFREFFHSESLLLAHADNLTLFDVGAFHNAFKTRPRDCSLTMMTFDTDDPKSCGIVTKDENNRIIEFTEKPDKDIGRLANGAVYIMDLADIFELMGLGTQVSDFSTEILPHLVGHMNSFHNALYHRDIGKLRALAEAQKDMGEMPEAYELIDSLESYWQPNEKRQKLLSEFQSCLEAVDLDSEAVRSLVKS
ncbi:MAG: nucleotidyltransferase family protein [Proteobacteria bacterium]|nr:nucleotidyltransferase family protein [Pseudomonadota bacterium]